MCVLVSTYPEGIKAWSYYKEEGKFLLSIILKFLFTTFSHLYNIVCSLKTYEWNEKKNEKTEIIFEICWLSALCNHKATGSKFRPKLLF